MGNDTTGVDRGSREALGWSLAVRPGGGAPVRWLGIGWNKLWENNLPGDRRGRTGWRETEDGKAVGDLRASGDFERLCEPRGAAHCARGGRGSLAVWAGCDTTVAANGVVKIPQRPMVSCSRFHIPFAFLSLVLL